MPRRASWSPIGFSLEDDGGDRLCAGTVRQVSARLLGAEVRFHLHTLAADASGLRLHARGPVDLLVHYSLRPVAAGCEMHAHVSIDPPRRRGGRLAVRAARTLLVAGTLDDALQRIAREAERSAGGTSVAASGMLERGAKSEPCVNSVLKRSTVPSKARQR